MKDDLKQRNNLYDFDVTELLKLLKVNSANEVNAGFEMKPLFWTSREKVELLHWTELLKQL